MSDPTQSEDEERALVIVQHWEDAYDGPGWYYYIEEYPDEGSVGAFATKEEAVAHAEKDEYRVEVRNG